MKSKLPVRWDLVAKDHLDEIYDYIAEDSVDAARHVKRSLIQLGNSLGRFPEKYSREEYLKDVPGYFRYVIIADIFNTTKNPSKIRRMKNG